MMIEIGLERSVSFQDVDNVTPEERQVRLKKADSIRRMLADTTPSSTAQGKRNTWAHTNLVHKKYISIETKY